MTYPNDRGKPSQPATANDEKRRSALHSLIDSLFGVKASKEEKDDRESISLKVQRMGDTAESAERAVRSRLSKYNLSDQVLHSIIRDL